MREHKWKVMLGLLGLVALLFGPHLVWRLRSSRSVNIAIVDKTVPFEKYREHDNLHWLLRALKITGPDGRFLDPASDYLGFDPRARKGRDLLPGDLESTSVLFFADTYGVYRGDYERPGDVAALERSPRIYGGLSVEEARLIEDFLQRDCTTVIGEFNTFASPTGGEARRLLHELFGVRWTRWVARYWPNVQDRNEVPRWVEEVYEKVYQAPLTFEGPALIFVKDDADMVVLRPGVHFDEDQILTIGKTAAAPEEWPDRGAYYFWLDVLEATTADVLYEHRVMVNDAGIAELRAHGLSDVFPAVTRRGRAYYLAGDFVDMLVDRPPPDRAGTLTTLQLQSYVGGTYEERFLWGWYAPLMASLLEEALLRRAACSP